MASTPTTPPIPPTVIAPLETPDLGALVEYRPQFSSTGADVSDGAAGEIAVAQSATFDIGQGSSTASSPQMENKLIFLTWLCLPKIASPAARATPLLALLSVVQLLHSGYQDHRCFESLTAEVEQQCTTLVAWSQNIHPNVHGDAAGIAALQVSCIWKKVKQLHIMAWGNLKIGIAVFDISYDSRAQRARRCILDQFKKRKIHVDTGHTAEFWSEVLNPLWLETDSDWDKAMELVQSKKPAMWKEVLELAGDRWEKPADHAPSLHGLATDDGHHQEKGGMLPGSILPRGSASPTSTESAPAIVIDLTDDDHTNEGESQHPAEFAKSAPAVRTDVPSEGEEDTIEPRGEGLTLPASSALDGAAKRFIGEVAGLPDNGRHAKRSQRLGADSKD